MAVAGRKALEDYVVYLISRLVKWEPSMSCIRGKEQLSTAIYSQDVGIGRMDGE